MVQIRVIDKPKSSGSPKGEVGEIDTRAPFQSVKAAVSLFGEVAISKDKGKAVSKRRLSSEKVLDKETQFVLVQRELEKYKQQLQVAEKTTARSYSELEKAKTTLNDLTIELKTATESKLSAVQAAETVKKQVKELEVAKSQQHFGDAASELELEQEREQYMIVMHELDLAKQELTQIRQDFDGCLQAKSVSFQQAAEVQMVTNGNIERISELSNEISAMQESTLQIKLATVQCQEQQESIMSEKQACIKAYAATKEDLDKKLMSLKEEYDPELHKKLEQKLSERNEEIEVIREEMKRAHAIEMDNVKLITTELNEATKTLQKVAEEENLLRNIVTALKLELDEVQREKSDLEKREKKKYDGQRSQLEKLSSEAETARTEAEEMKKKAKKLNQETETNMLTAARATEKLHLVQKELEEAKEGEKKAHDEMKSLSEKYNDQNPESNNNIIQISLQDIETSNKKVEESENTAEAKEADAKFEIEEINIRKNATEMRLEENLEAMKEIEIAIDIALKSAEIAEAAQSVVEGELRRWRQKHDNNIFSV
ncbi:WEB family protein At1g12150 [Manihot esculenta]|uniref:WEB family protein n=1 Tax=Manihot esculenta TaxID=3983 RepID=A0A2C9V8Z3_MANES|nr:WEB family protein At1g12150 [Manihot esculenta]OAY41219.1 hypothetical protein MANES_09G083200v8 [Manihot esculenta]